MLKSLNIQNVILITIDSLRYDRLGFAGGCKQCSPTLDSLAQTGITCRQSFTHSWYSQFSYPSIFTSSLPLDFGGYDQGIVHRPLSITEVLKQNGFKTVAFSSDAYLQSYYGYDRGFDEFYDLFDISLFWTHIKRDYLAYFYRLRNIGVMAEADFYRVVDSLLRHVFDFISSFSHKKQAELDSHSCLPNSIIHHYDFPLLYQYITNQQALLTQNPRGYIDKSLPSFSIEGSARSTHRYSTLVSRILKYMREWMETHRIDYEDIISKAASFGVNLWRYRAGKHVKGSYMSRCVHEWIDRQEKSGYFLWLCLNDIHDLNMADHLFSLSIARHSLSTMRFERRWKYLAYDLSIKYIDGIVEVLLSNLKEKGQLGKTLLVICSDHGKDLKHPQVSINTPVTFDDHIIKVPILLWNPKLESKTIDYPCGLIDIAPTIIDLIGLAPIPEFRGLPVYSLAASTRNHIILEHLGGGPCDFEHKSPQICIVSDPYKYIWTSKTSDELYRLGQNSVIPLDRLPHHTMIDALKKVAIQRYQAITGAVL